MRVIEINFFYQLLLVASKIDTFRQKNMKGLKTGGREQGTPNKLTSNLRERISEFLNDNWEQVEKDFKVLEPEKRIVMFEKLLQFTLPKLQTIQTPDMKTDNTPTLIIFNDYQNERELSKKIS